MQVLRRWMMVHTEMKWDMPVGVSEIPQDISTAVMAEIACWTGGYDKQRPELIEWNGRLIYSDPPEAVVFTDACSRAGGVWTAGDDMHEEIDMSFPFVGQEMQGHITFQETAAAADGLIHVLEERDYRMCTVAMKIDATAAIKYLRCNGGKKLKYAKRVWEAMTCARTRRVYVGGENDFEDWHVEGEANPADTPSRRNAPMAEWRLNSSAFNHLNKCWGPFTLDAFAAAWNKQLPRYLCRQRWDRQAIGHDALLHQYQHERGVVWAFPPPHKCITLQFLNKIDAAEAEAAVLLPCWRTTELALALQMATETPVLFECCEALLEPPEAFEVHGRRAEFVEWETEKQWWKKKSFKTLIGVRLSGHAGRRGAFLRAWQTNRTSSTSQERTREGVSILTER